MIKSVSALSGSTAEGHSTSPAIFRPVQYLGSKLRVVRQITEVAGDLVSTGTPAVDLFAGSSVVSQALARAGYAVTAVDTQIYSQMFSRAMLGVDRLVGERLDPSDLLGRADQHWRRFDRGWHDLAKQEDALLRGSDAAGLRAFDESLPLAWRLGRAEADADAHISSFYAGTYFGLGQAMWIDAIRSVILAEGCMPRWSRAAAITALLNAVSLAVHSAGKHFAQPMRGLSGNSAFSGGRLLTDRSINVRHAFIEACGAISEAAPMTDTGHSAVRAEAEVFVAQPKDDRALYYLDPPYTGQQYSRFYHVLETISSGARPSVPAGQSITAGIYPEERYKSAFSSRRARPALARILDTIAGRASSAIISYSRSAAGSDGNARMIGFDDLIHDCREAFGARRVEVVDLEHRYRQFNSGGRSNMNRDDREVLIICRSV